MNQQPIRIIQITDSHLFKDKDGELLKINTHDTLTGVVKHIKTHEKQIDVVLATGDISQDHSAQAYKIFLELAGDLAPITRGLPGNHDTPEILDQVWGDLATPVTDIGNWRIVMLNTMVPQSNAGFLEQDQLNLLENAANQTPDKHILVALHHNPVPVGSKWLDTMMVANGHELFAIVAKLPNVKLMIWGHIHQEYHGTYNFGGRHLPLLGCPSTCVQFAPGGKGFGVDQAAPGYRWIDLYPDGNVETEVVRATNIDITPDIKSKGY